MTSRVLVGLALAAVLLGPAVPVGAEESRPALNAPLILNMLALPMEKPQAAFQESLRGAHPLRGSPSEAAPEWQQLEDGSYQYGGSRLTVIIKNPCPEGKPYAFPALPGRRR